jgi:hypothetical protein
MSNRTLFLVVAAISLLAGCVTNNQKYDWGKYDASLYAYYKDPAKAAELSAALAAVIEDANSNRTKVPPGVYAEYGYLQMQQGKNQDAINSFKQEAALWPESKVFMDQMTKVASASAPIRTSQSSSP